MRATTESMLKSLVRERALFKRWFPLNDGFVHVTCALACMPFGDPRSSAIVKERISLIKRDTSLSSPYRVQLLLPVASMLSFLESADAFFEYASRLYGQMTSVLGRDDYLAMSVILCAGEEGFYGSTASIGLAEKARDLLLAVKEKNASLSGGNLASLCVLAACANVSEERFANDAEIGYTVLSDRFGVAQGLQTCAHVLALAGGDVAGNARKVTELYDGLLAHGCAFGTSYELSSLAALVAADSEAMSSLVLDEEISEATCWLKRQRGFGLTSSITGVQRALISCMAMQWGFARERSFGVLPMVSKGTGAGGLLSLAGSFVTVVTALSKTSNIAIGL